MLRRACTTAAARAAAVANVPRAIAAAAYSTLPVTNVTTATPTPDPLTFVLPARPASPAYFTGNAAYFDLLYQVRQHVGPADHAALVETIRGDPEPYAAIRKLLKSKDALFVDQALSMTDAQYETLAANLIALYVVEARAIAAAKAEAAAKKAAKAAEVAAEVAEGEFEVTAEPTEALETIASEAEVDSVPGAAPSPSFAPLPLSSMSKFLGAFLNPASIAQAAAAPRKPDQHGRAFAKGSRKTSRAHVWVVPGTGHFKVNGDDLATYFVGRRDAEAATYPLQVADAFGRYNVWAVVHGGGPTGQAEAIANAVARALVVHDQSLRERMEAVQLLIPDTRQVERKKPGQAKARKKFTWVKR
ncbi:37S ribosomal protein S9, mitochondrial [Allomyces arbusculus]|nr:37S ribosomal protein S9, mitochondrial [Allomyces arbusculus]